MANMLDELVRESEQFAWAGAVAARGDAKLAHRRETLRAAGTKVVALAKTGELCQALMDANDEEAGAALLQLGAAAAQLRVAVMNAAVEGKLTPLAQKIDVTAFATTPVRELYAVRNALQSRKKPPESLTAIITDERTVRDPRLWPHLLAGFRHAYLREAAAVAAGRIGEPILPLLESSFKITGGVEDAARLDAMAAIRKASGEDLYRRAIQEGSPPVQIAGVLALRWVGAGELERAALALLPQLKEADALVSALAPVATGNLLDALIAHVETHKKGDWEFAPFLNVILGVKDGDGGSALAKVTRLSELVMLGLRRSLDARQQFFAREALWHLALVNGAVGASALVRTFLGMESWLLRSNAADHLVRLGSAEDREVVIAAAENDPNLARHAVAALFLLGDAVALERLRPLYAPFMTAPAGKQSLWGAVKSALGGAPPTAATAGTPDARLGLALLKVTKGMDPRWFDVAVALLRHLPTEASRALATLENPAALAPLIEVAREKPKRVDHVYTAIGAVGRRDAVPFLADLLSRTTELDAVTGLIGGLAASGDATAVPHIEKLLAGTKDSLVTSAASEALRILRP